MNASAPEANPEQTPREYEHGRDEMVDYLRRHLVGPFSGPDEVLTDVPHRRYLMAVLFPRESDANVELDEEELELPGGGPKDEQPEDPVTLSNSWMPSSLGLSFFVSSCEGVRCDTWGSRYTPEKEGRATKWRRTPIAEEDAPQRVTLKPVASGGLSPGEPSLDGLAMVTAFWRPVEGGFLVTVVMANAQKAPKAIGASGEDHVDPALCLHQVGIRCSSVGGSIREYPSVEALSRDPEDEELRLQHRRAKAFAIGHGCAADWSLPKPDETTVALHVQTVHIPVFDVPALTHGGPADSDVLRMSRWADATSDKRALLTDLRTFVAGYDGWVKTERTRHSDIPSHLAKAATRICDALAAMVTSLSKGIELLDTKPAVLRAFQLANLAMLMQMRHASAGVAGVRRSRDQGVHVKDGYLTLEYRWRPFQLAYMLLCLPSIAEPGSADREIVDLLWFPTGGGKTEAYLALAAFQIISRRHDRGNRGAGTTVITRYTLRLLTAQQFQRATTLVCALEVIRQVHVREMGDVRVSIGLWVGEDQSPNDLAKARELREAMLLEEHPVNKFQLDQCPWCGTELVPREKAADELSYGIRITNTTFSLFCPSAECRFHAELPVSIVDEDLYRSPPTFLLATVDKFARLAWVDSAVAFFGGGKYDPPSLIIQDEMHLLSGPLGTTVAVYESAIEALCEYHGARPKILASTATIRNASEQARGLFGTTVRVFPPGGLSADDSYFATRDLASPGRRYVGIMAQSHTPQTTMIHTAAALLQAPIESGAGVDRRDDYWTLVAYHNSLRELGRTATLFRDDIPSRIESIATDQSNLRKLGESDVVELTGNVRGDELGRILARLSVSMADPDAISCLISTNMLSVGVDIPRLGLMLMNGQPKSTSEYIQATSRVGRAQVPGLVVALYNSTKPRDRSHYEGFRAYHSALYRYVEPTSVTPFSLPSRQRSLHAAFVILMRHGAGLSTDDAAGRFDRNAKETVDVVELLLARVRRVDVTEVEATTLHLRRLCDEWSTMALAARKEGRALYYKPAGKSHSSLLKDFGASGDGWPTLHSMRNVDRQCNVTVVGE